MLLVAPAGYGKTTLARQWVSKKRHAWYQATAASSDVAALALGLAASTAGVVGQVGESLRGRLQTLGDAASEARSLSADLARDLADWPSDVRLVIDDYQLLAESNAAEAFIEGFLGATTLPCLILSRSRPSWVTAKALLYGDVVELGRNVLAMTHAEAAEALATSHEEIPGLVTLAEGWPAVIGLAALVPYPLPNDASEIPETLHQYFAEELYDAANPVTRRAAVQLSIAPIIDSTVARALFAKRQASVLEQCYRSGFLTKTLSGYEMHPLVRQFLRTKQAEFEPEEVRTAAEVIANAYVATARWDDAASVAADFGLANVMLRVLNDALDVVLSEGRLATLRRWLDPVRLVAPTAPIVQLASIEIDFRNGDWMAASSKARQLARAISTDGPLTSRVFLRAGQMAHIDDRHEEALRLFTAAKVHAQSSKDLRNALWSRLLTLCDLEQRAEAESTLQEIENLPALNSDDLLRAGQGRLQFASRWGSLVEALDGVSGLLGLVDDSTDPLVRTGFLQTYGAALGLVARYGEVTPVANRQLDEAERYHLDWIVPHALQMGAVAQMGMRDFEGALRSIERAVGLAKEQGNLHTQLNGLVLRARVDLCCGSSERAVDLLEKRDTPFTSTGMEGEYLATLALALACCGRTEEALAQIDVSERVSSQLDAAPMRDFARLIATHSVKGQIDVSLRLEAFRTVITTGNFDAFVCAYRAFPPLLNGLPEADPSDSARFVALVSALDPSHAEKIGLPVAMKDSHDKKPLTRREQEVFGLMCQGLANREIARTLWISESTVKVHVHHVLAKMGVRSRTEAVATALESESD
jgi:LuxR family maltose regulon positive regulatory protein